MGHGAIVRVRSSVSKGTLAWALYKHPYAGTMSFWLARNTACSSCLVLYYTIYSRLYTICYMRYTIYYILYTIYCILYTIYYILYTLCYTILYYAVLCYAMLCYAMLCYAMLCYAMLCYAMLCYAMLCYAMLCLVYVGSSVNGYQAKSCLRHSVGLRRRKPSSRLVCSPQAYAT